MSTKVLAWISVRVLVLFRWTMVSQSVTSGSFLIYRQYLMYRDLYANLSWARMIQNLLLCETQGRSKSNFCDSGKFWYFPYPTHTIRPVYWFQIIFISVIKSFLFFTHRDINVSEALVTVAGNDSVKLRGRMDFISDILGNLHRS